MSQTASVLLQSQPIALCGAEGLDFHGTRLVPDDTKAYLEFAISHSYPVVTAYGTGLEAGTIRNSHASMLHQVFNLLHEMKAYHPDREMKGDRIIGSVVAEHLMEGPQGTYIHGAAVIHKLAHGVDRVLGQHQSGRHEWTVSMEVRFDLFESGWILGGPEGQGLESLPEPARELCARCTPDKVKRQGRAYLPWSEAPEDLLACYSREEGRVTQAWQGVPTVLLMGGVDGQVHYHGVGLVPYGAEPTARIARVLAEHPVGQALERFAQAFQVLK